MQPFLDPALTKLLRLRLRAGVRRITRGLKTVRGALLFVLGLATFGLMIGPQFVFWHLGKVPSHPEMLITYVPVGMLVFCLFALLGSAQQKGLMFSPAEVDFLFSGPFSRRQVLIYKLASGFAGLLLVSLIFSVAFRPHVGTWVGGFVGFFLALWFVQLFTTCVVLLGQTFSERAVTRARRWTLLALLCVAAVGLGTSVADRAQGGLLPLVQAFQQSTAGRYLLAPFEVFSQPMTATQWIPDLVAWSAAALAVDLCLLAAVLWLDVNYLEVSAATSRKVYERLRRAKRGGVAWDTSAKPRWRLPLFPHLGGAGPIARKQLTTALRTSRGLLTMVAVMAVVAAPMFLASARAEGIRLAALAGPLAMLTVMFTRMAPFDFRGDLEQLDWLKSLPVRPMAIAAGQLITPVALMTALHLLLVAAVTPFYTGPVRALWALAAFSPLVNLLLFALDNAFFLLFPTRTPMGTPGDFQGFGRVMAEMFVKLAVVGACGGAAAGVGAVAYWWSGGSWGLALSAAWFVLAAFGLAAVGSVAWAFMRFDVSTETPP